MFPRSQFFHIIFKIPGVLHSFAALLFPTVYHQQLTLSFFGLKGCSTFHQIRFAGGGSRDDFTGHEQFFVINYSHDQRAAWTCSNLLSIFQIFLADSESVTAGAGVEVGLRLLVVFEVFDLHFIVKNSHYSPTKDTKSSRKPGTRALPATRLRAAPTRLLDEWHMPDLKMAVPLPADAASAPGHKRQPFQQPEHCFSLDINP